MGLLLGGVLTEYADWRWCLLVNIPIAAVALAAAVPLVPESRAHGDTRYDVPGAVVVTAGLVSLVYGFTRAAEDSWSATGTIAFIAAGVVLLGVFVVIELRSDTRCLPMRILLPDRNRGCFVPRPPTLSARPLRPSSSSRSSSRTASLLTLERVSPPCDHRRRADRRRPAPASDAEPGRQAA